MDNGEITWWPACIPSITIPAKDRTAFMLTYLAYDADTDKSEHFNMSIMDRSCSFHKHFSTQQAKEIYSIVVQQFAGVFQRPTPKNIRKKVI